MAIPVGALGNRAYYSTLVGASVFAAVYGWAAVAKGGSLGQFETAIIAASIVPGGYEVVLARVLVLTESLIAVSLLVPLTRQNAARASLGLTSHFFGYNVWRALGHIPTPCSCLGPAVRLPVELGLGLNVAMAWGSAWLALASARRITSSVPVQLED